MNRPEQRGDDSNLPPEVSEIRSMLETYTNNGTLEVLPDYNERRSHFRVFYGSIGYVAGGRRARAIRVTQGAVRNRMLLTEQPEHLLTLFGVFRMLAPLPEGNRDGIHGVNARGDLLTGSARYTSYFSLKPGKVGPGHTVTGVEAWKEIFKHVGDISMFLHAD